MKPTTPQRKGFTLTELMVVLAVIALLVAIIVPATKAVYAQARTTVCQRNLYSLSVAFSNRGADAKMEKSPPFAPANWPGALLTYVGNDRKAYVCPEDENLTDPVPELEKYYILDNSSKFHMPLESAPLTAKLNQTQYATFKPDEATKQRIVPPYVDDGTGIWWYCFEDLRTDAAGTTGGGDKDFDDIQVRCSMQPDYRVKIEFKKGGSSHSFSFCDPQKKVVSGYETLGGNLTMPAYYIAGGSSSVSFGFNGYSQTISGGQRVVLAMDYEAVVVSNGSTAVDSRIDDWAAMPHFDKGKLTFARHRGRVNVVWADGAVTPINPLNIDIRLASLRGQYWIPQ